MRALYPGSFDPITSGHVDVINRVTKLFDEVVIAVLINKDKESFIPIQDRINLIKESIGNEAHVSVESFSGLTVDFAQIRKADVIIRGLRAPSDFEYELEMSQVNHFLSNGLDTIFLMTNPKYSFIRSSRILEVVRLGGDVRDLVPEPVYKYLCKKLRTMGSNLKT